MLITMLRSTSRREALSCCAGAKALIQSIGQSGHKTGWLRERFTGQSAVKQEKDPLALWGGSPGPSGQGAVTYSKISVYGHLNRTN
jgi:hypothetical protein